jgi:hypothetical protein
LRFLVPRLKHRRGSKHLSKIYMSSIGSIFNSLHFDIAAGRTVFQAFGLGNVGGQKENAL